MNYALWDNLDSFWLAEEYIPNPPLTGQIQADVAIIGGGITGLSSAYHLKRRYPEKHIVLIEGQAVGFGASGRNSGFISQEYHGWYERFERKGAAAVAPYTRYAERGYQLLVQTIREQTIACDLQDSGALLLGKNATEARSLEEHARAYSQTGRPAQLWEGAELTARIKTDFYPAGLFLPHWSLLHPGKLMRGLKAVVERLGVVVYERTPVQRIHQRKTIELDCGSGQVRAATAILATNAYTPKLGFLQSTLMPLHLFVVVTQPLETVEIEQGGWSAVPGRFELDRSHTVRLTPDGRLLIRGGARYYYDNGITYKDVPHAYQSLCQRLQLRYPQLKEVSRAYAWSGVMALTRAFTPLFGRIGRENNILYSVGYNGFGLVNGFYGGKLLCDLYGGELHEDLQLMSSRDGARRLLPEPLRYAHINTSLAARGFRL
ncbi:MAG: FAD-binding oxidoreductase [Deltaproteobacteria bacterium]|nr:FAD-binding oxidoreductase [Deltaproteobacteria bacterium]